VIITISIIIALVVAYVVIGLILIGPDNNDKDDIDDEQNGSNDILTRSFSIKLLDNETNTYRFELHGDMDLQDQENKYFLDFDDGSSPMRITESNFTYSYAEINDTNPALIKIDGNDNEEVLYEAEIPFKFGDRNLNPIAVGAYERIEVKKDDQPVILTAPGSYDIDGEIIGYYWDYGDGYHSDVSKGINGYAPTNGEHLYEKTGTYYAELFVMDNNLTTCEEPWTIEVIIS
jgi:hypothetical protein